MTYCVDTGTEHIKETLEDKPQEAYPLVHLLKSVELNPVEDRDDGR